MINVIVREPKIEDREAFISAMQHSRSLHHPWVKAPTTSQEFDEYFQRYQQPDNVQSIQLVKKNGFRYEGFSPRYLKIDNEWRGHEHWAMTYEDFKHQ